MRGLQIIAVEAAVVILLVAGLCGCNKHSAKSATAASIPGSSDEESVGSTESSASATLRGEKTTTPTPRFRLPIVVIETNLGNIKVRLRDDKAPLTVENFLENYVDRGFYEQTIFHHVEKNVMIAAGGYTSDLQAKPTRAWIRNESNNGLSNKRGTIAMAHHPDYPHSATSQFFINIADNPSFDFRAPQEGEVTEDAYGYCVFGEVVEGIDVADRIASANVQSTEMFPAAPVEPVIIQALRRDDSASSPVVGVDPSGNPTNDLDLQFNQDSFSATTP